MASLCMGLWSPLRMQSNPVFNELTAMWENRWLVRDSICCRCQVKFKQMLLRIIQSARTMILTILSSCIRQGQGLCIDKNWILSSIAVGNSSSHANPGMGSRWAIAFLGRSWSLQKLVWNCSVPLIKIPMRFSSLMATRWGFPYKMAVVSSKLSY